MMRKRLVCLLCSSLVFPVLAAEQQSFLCMPDQSTGFEYSRPAKRWNRVRFGVDEIRYLLHVNAGNAWQMEVFGKNMRTPVLSTICTALGGEGLAAVSVGCGGLISLKFNLKTSRFIVVDEGGYIAAVEDTGVDPGTPYIAIGKCVSRPTKATQ
jgi:hypothetical protein